MSDILNCIFAKYYEKENAEKRRQFLRREELDEDYTKNWDKLDVPNKKQVLDAIYEKGHEEAAKEHMELTGLSWIRCKQYEYNQNCIRIDAQARVKYIGDGFPGMGEWFDIWTMLCKDKGRVI